MQANLLLTVEDESVIEVDASTMEASDIMRTCFPTLRSECDIG